MTTPPPLADRIEHALCNAHHTHPCTCGSQTWASCFHDGKLSNHQARRTAAVLAVVQPELDRLNAELEQARQQTENAHCRLHHIQARVEQITLDVDPTGIGLDLIPWLDGPLHPDHLAAYRAAAQAPPAPAH